VSAQDTAAKSDLRNALTAEKTSYTDAHTYTTTANHTVTTGYTASW